MSVDHKLREIIRAADGFLLIGDSESGRFPSASYNSYTRTGKRFYCLDLGGLTESRGLTRGGPVYTRIADLPDERDDLAVIWVHAYRAAEAVSLAHQAGCRRVWFSFQTATEAALALADELGMSVVEVGRCPVFFMDQQAGPCRVHTTIARLTGLLRGKPQTALASRRRELL